MKTLILTDNPGALSLSYELQAEFGNMDISQSPSGTLADVSRVDVRQDLDLITASYSLLLSLHCRQVFPPELISRVRCVNVHPGFNPFNRGWYPHVFSIINGMKAGVTIHEIDERIDHGPIIVQREYVVKPWETSDVVYANLMAIERELLFAWFVRIRDGAYVPYRPDHEGNLNTKKDFEVLRHLDLERVGRFGDFLNVLRALSHGVFRNAYFLDESGRRIYVKVTLEQEPGS